MVGDAPKDGVVVAEDLPGQLHMPWSDGAITGPFLPPMEWIEAKIAENHKQAKLLRRLRRMKVEEMGGES